MLESILQKTKFSSLLEGDSTDYVWIDISLTNEQLENVDVSNASQFSEYINLFLKENNAKIAMGGYNEARNIYKRSENFNSSDLEERFIHLGIDLWTKAYTAVSAPLKGKVHSFGNNLGVGNYGPTIILEHNLKGEKFYTLYGHLTKDSIEDLIIGEAIDKGEMFAAIGNFPANGDYPPHLHFQIIKDLKGMSGDFPGVTSNTKQEEDLANCPDPNLILKISK
ncbi:peptidoglycan DD-metalloendopeptidase family protein [Vicingus serpentipes]|uniref:Peptidoglycan DD-metalloendopeptidase family protein n=1 Tax=Vicingus serpentipes TaxID=1926625 RepID=A0A5C6RRJ0_9FLAO|nr:peptidoglycan DD-metalloendopeptidase family protein [Vicingus serpentipes]TXB64777.1 peptidoglycan DD-metalloendopeptidase family protein [Vicingus serpentipes]